jgi:hypothetical protein
LKGWISSGGNSFGRGSLKRKYHLIKWSMICKNKKKGGLGVKNLRLMNLSLLCKWWWNWKSEEGLWQELVKLKYVKGTPIFLVKNRQSDSPKWCDIVKIRHIYLQGRKFMVNNGKLVSFWLDSWLEDKPLCSVYPILYDMCTNKSCSVWEVAKVGWVLQFRVNLPSIVREQ